MAPEEGALPPDEGWVTDGEWDWPSAMQAVAARFRGEDGVFLQFGDSLTIAAPNQRWALAGVGHTDAERAFLAWAHAGTRGNRDGWHLASARAGPEDEAPRAHTAGVGCSSRVLLAGGRGLPPLCRMIEEFNPRMALYAVGMSDVIRDVSVGDYLPAVEAGIDLLEANGTVPILSTLTPSKEKMAQVDAANAALRALARARRLPLLDFHAEMARRTRNVLDYLQEDGVHLTWDPPEGPVTEDNLRRSGYLLRCWLTVRKGMEVRERALVPIAAQPRPDGRQ